MDEEMKLRAGFMLVLDARAHLLAGKNPDFAADKVLQKIALKLIKKLFPKKSKGICCLNWLAYISPDRKSYADVKIVEL